MTSDPASSPARARAWRLDALLVLAVLIGAAVYQRAYGAGPTPSFRLGGDAGNIAAFAAAADAPEAFAGDMLLGDPSNVRFYVAAQVPVVRALARLTGDYAAATELLLGAHLALYLLGWYAFGRRVFRRRCWAVAWMLLQLACVRINLGEFWGPGLDVIPRFTFQALLPWILAGCLRPPPGSRLDWLAPTLTAALVWVHPVSAPGWTLAVGLGLLSAPGADRRRMALAALPALAMLAAYALVYLGGRGEPAADSQAVLAAMRDRLGPAQVSVVWAVGGCLKWLLVSGLLPLGGLGAWALVRRRRELDDAERRLAVRLLAWLAGLLTSAVGLPLIDQALAAARGGVPWQVDLVRGLRYVIPLALLAALWAAADLCERHPPARRRQAWIAAALAAAWLAWHPFGYRAQPASVPNPAFDAALRAVLEVVPPRGRVLPFDTNALAVRYGARRPVVFAPKDGGALSYSNQTALLRWHGLNQRYQRLRAQDDTPDKLRRILVFAGDCGAEYVFAAWRGGAVPGAIYQAEGYLLLRVPPAVAVL